MHGANTARRHPGNPGRPHNRPGGYSGNRGPVGNNNMSRSKLETEINGVYKNSRFTYNLTTLIGCNVEVQVKNGKQYAGILKTFSSELEVVLECAHLLDQTQPDKIPRKSDILEKLIVNFNDMVIMRAVDADTKFGETDSFTDTGISRAQVNGVIKDSDLKELTPWDDSGLSSSHLDDSTDGSGWTAEEMFRSNKEKFGIESSYDDSLHLYTTKLEKSNTPEFNKRRLEAERLASEIESNSASHRNIALENGDEIDEETKYSAVIRPTQQQPQPGNSFQTRQESNNSKKYMPPHRKLQGDQLSQSVRLNGASNQQRIPDRNKTSPQTHNANKPEDIARLKSFSNNFRLASSESTNESSQVSTSSTSASAPSEQKSPPKDQRAHPRAPQDQRSPKATQQPPAIKTMPQPAPPVIEKIVAKTEAAPPVASAPPQSGPPPTTGGSVATPTVPQPAAVTSEAKPSSATESKSAPSTASASKLNPEAKEFVFHMKAPVVPSQPAPQVPAQSHAHHQQHYVKSAKTATVSVVDSKPPSRQELVNPVQHATGAPIINQPHSGHPPQYMMVPSRLHRSYSGGDGQPVPSQAQPQAFIHAHPQYVPTFVPTSMMSHMSMPHPQASGGMPPPPTPPQGAHSQQHPQQQVPQQGGSGGVMNSNQSPATSQHMQQTPQHNPSGYHNHQGANPQYMYATMAPPSGQPTQQQPSQPPLQPSPHNPSPSPVTMNNGVPMGQAAYHAYQPPHPQQFYPAQGGHLQAAVSQGAPTGHFNVVYLPPQQAGAAPYHYYYHQQMQAGYPHGFPPQ